MKNLGWLFTLLLCCLITLNVAVAQETFRLRGRAFNRNLKLMPDVARKARFNIRKRVNREAITIVLSTDFPELVEFRHEIVNFNPRQRKFRTFVTLASFDDFSVVFPEIATGESVSIPVTAIDVTNGVEDTSMSITVRAP